MSLEILPVAVVGVGYLGKFHAEKYASSEKANLIGVVDVDGDRAREIGQLVGAPAFTDYHELFGRIRCASIAVPTRYHHQVARDFLDAGIDVLVEKPLTADLTEANELVALAAAKGALLQVGHLERFNPAIRRLEGIIKDPKFVECHRLAPFIERGTDVDVVLGSDDPRYRCDHQLGALADSAGRVGGGAGVDRNAGHRQCAHYL